MSPQAYESSWCDEPGRPLLRACRWRTQLITAGAYAALCRSGQDLQWQGSQHVQYLGWKPSALTSQESMSPAELSILTYITPHRFFLTPEGNPSSHRALTRNFADTKLTFIGTPPACAELHHDFHAAMDNLRRSMGQVASPGGKASGVLEDMDPHAIRFTYTPFRFASDSHVDVKPHDDVALRTVDEWPTTDHTARSALNAMRGIYEVRPLRAFCYCGGVVTPDRYEQFFKGVFCQVYFTVTKNTRKGGGTLYDLFVAAPTLIRALEPCPCHE